MKRMMMLMASLGRIPCKQLNPEVVVIEVVHLDEKLGQNFDAIWRLQLQNCHSLSTQSLIRGLSFASDCHSYDELVAATKPKSFARPKSKFQAKNNPHKCSANWSGGFGSKKPSATTNVWLRNYAREIHRTPGDSCFNVARAVEGFKWHSLNHGFEVRFGAIWESPSTIT
uniref:HDC14429 n=1 Tax=Drosophila melanogaster TaxID=7227 RepID=Q6IJQ9_DROME|nr:TPA_inf: HDC14429 [Drosophila melanogaster]